MKKYYKFIFIALFGLFIFLPKDTFALGIDFYNSSGSTGSCSGCSNDKYVTSNLMQDVNSFHIYFGNEFTFYTNYTYQINIKFKIYSNDDYNLRLGEPLFCSTGSCPPITINTYTGTPWAITDEYAFWPHVKSVTISGDFTIQIQGTSGYLEFNPEPVDLYGIKILEYSVVTLNDGTGAIINNSANQILQNQNKNTQLIIESNKELKQEQEKTNEELGKLNDNLTNEDSPDLDALEDSTGWLPPGPVDSILNLPLTFFNNLISNLSKTCQPVNIPLPYVNKHLSLPCISTLYEQIGATTFLNWVGLIVGTIILYNYLLNLYKWVDDTIQMKDNSVDDWGGV